MYEELVNRLREAPNDWPDANLHYEAANVIEELSVVVRAQKAVLDKFPRWISVTERLPEKGQNVLVANKRGKQWDIDKAWLSCLGSGFDRCGKRPLYNVTHWMLLPEPPEEK